MIRHLCQPPPFPWAETAAAAGAGAVLTVVTLVLAAYGVNRLRAWLVSGR